MQIYINGNKESINEGLTVEKLLEQFSLVKKSVAVELNKQVLQKDVYSNTPLHENDRLEIVHFVGGG